MFINSTFEKFKTTNFYVIIALKVFIILNLEFQATHYFFAIVHLQKVEFEDTITNSITLYIW